MRFIDLVSLVASNEHRSQPCCSSTAPSDIEFRSGSHLTADRQASNAVQIVHKKPAAPVVSEADGKGLRKISSLPISLPSFAAKFSVKDLEPSDVAFVELSLSNPGSAIRRFVFHLCVAFNSTFDFLSCFTYANSTGRARFSFAVSYGGESDSSLGTPMPERKEMFHI